MFGQLLLNIMLAFLWLLLQDESKFEVSTFFAGFLIGMVIIYMMRRFFFREFYLRRLFAFGLLLLLFTKELFTSSILVVRQVLSPRLQLKPGIFAYDTQLEGEWEVTMLSLLVILTPGSVVIEVAPSNKRLYIHVMDIPESKGAVLRAMKKFEKAIMGVTR
ncbi:Na+/H+ antiporter subunit E [Bacillus sp. FSL W7-1360]